MLNHPTWEKLDTLKLTGMAKALKEQMETPDIGELSFEERLGLMVDREINERDSRKLAVRLRKAKFRERASMEDIDYKAKRGLDKSLMLNLASCQWIRDHANCLVVGPTGIGKTYIACALGHKACMEGYASLYFRLPKLLDDLEKARGDGRYSKLMKTFAKTDVVILDDLGFDPMTAGNRRDLLELMEERYVLRSTIVTSQLPVNKWHESIGDPTLADAILDRVVHNAHKIVMKGESMRKAKSKLTNPAADRKLNRQRR